MEAPVSDAKEPVSLADDPNLKQPDGTLYETEFWGIARHELIAGVAEELLGVNARQQVKQIMEPLGPVGLPDIAAWADQVKRMRPDQAPDDDTRNFLTDVRNKSNGDWHFVDIPLDAD